MSTNVEDRIKKCKTNGDALGLGRRKSSVARVRIRPGTGLIQINKRELDEFFCIEMDRKAILDVLATVQQAKDIDIIINVNGGGTTGQAGACRMGLARALLSYNPDLFPPLRDAGFLTRDSRMKERKKPGRHGARRGTQFSKR
jgi:small subunit ribosomal protein S9